MYFLACHLFLSYFIWMIFFHPLLSAAPPGRGWFNLAVNWDNKCNWFPLLLNYAVSEYRPQSAIFTTCSDSITAAIVGQAVVVWLLYVAQWYSTGRSSQESWVEFLVTVDFFTFLYFHLLTSKCPYSWLRQEFLSIKVLYSDKNEDRKAQN